MKAIRSSPVHACDKIKVLITSRRGKRRSPSSVLNHEQGEYTLTLYFKLQEVGSSEGKDIYFSKISKNNKNARKFGNNSF